MTDTADFLGHGCYFLSGSRGWLRRVLPVVREAGLGSIGALVSQLRRTQHTPLHSRVVEAMTTNETSFFRDIHPFEALKKTILPELMKRRTAERQLNIWCGAASTGQETFSVLVVMPSTLMTIIGIVTDVVPVTTPAASLKL